MQPQGINMKKRNRDNVFNKGIEGNKLEFGTAIEYTYKN